jgi:hypothetical protein
MKLNRELTEQLFKCNSEEELKAIIATGADLNTASRMAIDEVLNRVYKKRCTGIKDLAVQMLVGAANGVEVPDVSVTPDLNQPQAPQIPGIDPEERMERIKVRTEAVVFGAKDHFIRMPAVKKDAELKMLGASDEDLKKVASGNEKIVCGSDSNGKLYLMERNEQVMNDLSSKWGDKFF